jgi:hypothetical protein
MRCAIISIHNDNYKEMADLTWHRNRKLYAIHRGYDHIVKTDNFGDTNIGFWKVKLLLEIMEQQNHDVLHFSGTDTMITNFTMPLTELVYETHHVTIATDFNGIQADSLLVRNTPEGRGWLQMIMDKMPQYLNHLFFEQGVMMETYEQQKHIVKVVPQRFMNSYHYPLYNPHKGAKNNNDAMGFCGQWQKGDWLLHAPDQKMHVRMALFNHILPLVVK